MAAWEEDEGMIGGGLNGGWGLRLLVDLGVLEAEEEAPDEAAEEAERRQAISLFLGLSPLCMSCRNMYMSWQPSLCRMSISLEVCMFVIALWDFRNDFAPPRQWNSPVLSQQIICSVPPAPCVRDG